MNAPGSDIPELLEVFLPSTLFFVVSLASVGVVYFQSRLDRNWKDIILDVFPLYFCIVVAISFYLFVEEVFRPDSILIPWIYFADVVPWLMILVLAYCLRQRLRLWNSFWRPVLIALVGLVIGFPLVGLFQNVNDEVGARRMTLAGSEDPYDLYGDESGMRNHGTQMLAQDTWNDCLSGSEATLILTPIILLLTALIYYRLNIIRFMSGFHRRANEAITDP